MSSSRVYVTDRKEEGPTYHKETTEEAQGPYGKVHRAVTVCGRTTSFAGDTVRLPEEWAEQFASRCRECYE